MYYFALRKVFRIEVRFNLQSNFKLYGRFNNNNYKTTSPLLNLVYHQHSIPLSLPELSLTNHAESHFSSNVALIYAYPLETNQSHLTIRVHRNETAKQYQIIQHASLGRIRNKK